MKKEISSEKVLSVACFIMSIIIRCALPVPFLVISETIIFKWAEDVWMWKYLAVIAITAAFGVSLVRLIIKVDDAGKKKLAKALRITVYVVGEVLVAAGVWTVHGLNAATLVAFGLISWSFLSSATSARMDYTNSFTTGHVVAVVVVYVASLIVSKLMNISTEFNMNISQMVFCLIISMGCIAVLLNQSTLDDMASSRRKTTLPDKVRINNLKLVGVFVVCLLVGYFFSDQIMAGVKYIVESILRGGFFVVSLFFRFINWMFSLFRNGKYEELPEEDSDGLTLPDELRSDEEAGAELVAIAIVIMIVLALLCKFVPGFMKKLLEILKVIKKYILSIFGRVAFKVKGDDGSEYFNDVEEKLDEMTEEEQKVVYSKREERKRLKNAQSKYNKSSGRERIRNGYNLLLEVLRYKEIPASAADTAQEIPGKIEDKELAGQFTAAAPIYDKVRYGERDCTQEDSANFDAAVTKAYSNAINKK